MRTYLLAAVAALTVAAAPLSAQAQSANQAAGSAAGATTGAVTGAIVGGPIGAIVGGAIGAAAGGALAPPEAAQVQQYVVTQRRPSVRVQERVVVGEDLPPTVQLYAVPAETGVRTQYRYSVVNDRTVLVDPQTRQIIQVIE
jgi:phage tail tape-measure protein